MRETLKYFIWGFQQDFRSSLQLETERLLDRIGLPVKPRALLVGFAAASDAPWPICIEPEYRFFQPDHLAGVAARADELYESHPRRNYMASDSRMNREMHLSLRDRCRADAVIEALEKESPEPIAYFAGHSARIGAYDVHPVIGIPSHALDDVPRLDTSERDHVRVTRSLVEGCVDIVLSLSRKALFEPDAGANLSVLGSSTDEIARNAAGNLVSSAVRLAGDLSAERLYSTLMAVSTTHYEGETGYGSLIVAARDNADISIEFRLEPEITVSEIRTVRKLLEISDRDRTSLLTDGSRIYGFGHAAASYDASREDIFRFDVAGQGQWVMRHGDAQLVEVEFGQPRLPEARVDRAGFLDTATRLFRDSTDADREQLWALAIAATEQAHGTMLVITEEAESEAARLSSQAIGIQPARLTPELLKKVTAIDGAALFAPDGTCHALGVILDGTASESGDRSRGARYNSAVRYVRTRDAKTMIVLVSEDGMINILPTLKPRIRGESLQEAIETYERLNSVAEVDDELRADAHARLKSLAFYLSAEQCERINAIENAYWNRRAAAGGIRLIEPLLAPDPAMNDSYFA